MRGLSCVAWVDSRRCNAPAEVRIFAHGHPVPGAWCRACAERILAEYRQAGLDGWDAAPVGRESNDDG